MMKQNHWWHTLVDEIWDTQTDVNFPEAELMLLRARFQLNLNEENVMIKYGSIKVVASTFGNKVQKNMDDCRVCVTIIRIESVAGDEAPIECTYAAKENSDIPVPVHGDAIDKGLPASSRAIVSPVASLRDDMWIEFVPHICEGM